MRSQVRLEDRESRESPVEVVLVDPFRVGKLVIQKASQEEKWRDELQKRSLASAVKKEGDEKQSAPRTQRKRCNRGSWLCSRCQAGAGQRWVRSQRLKEMKGKRVSS